MKQPAPILVADRFPSLRTQLLGLLADLSEDEWARPTAAPQRSVKDVAAHLLGGAIVILARMRDGFHPAGAAVRDYDQLVALVNRLNPEWVLAHVA